MNLYYTYTIFDRCLLTQNEKIKALLGNFSSTQILRDVMHFPDRTKAFEVDRFGLKKLCDIFIEYCIIKITENSSYTNGVSHNGSNFVGNMSNLWLNTQEWVSVSIATISYSTSQHNRKLLSLKGIK